MSLLLMFMGHHHDHQDYQLHQSDNRNDLNGDVSLGLGSTSSQLVKIGVSGSTLFQVLAIIMMMRMIELMIITMIVTVISLTMRMIMVIKREDFRIEAPTSTQLRADAFFCSSLQ